MIVNLIFSDLAKFSSREKEINAKINKNLLILNIIILVIGHF